MSLRGHELAAGFTGDCASRWSEYRRRIAAVNWFVPALLIVMGLGISTLVTRLDAVYLGGMIAAILLGAVFLNRLHAGLVALLWVSALNLGQGPTIASPHSSYAAGVMTSQALLALLVALWLGKTLLTDRLRPAKSEMNLPMILLGVTALVSLVVSNMLGRGGPFLFNKLFLTQAAEVILLWCSILAFFLAANVLREERHVNMVFAPVVALSLYFAAHRIVGFQLHFPVIWGSLLLAAGIAFTYSRLLFSATGRYQKYWLSLLFGILAFGAFNNLSWVSGWVAATGAILVVSFHKSRYLAAGLVAVFLIAMFVWPGIYHDIHAESEGGGDFERFIIWRDAALMMFSINPVLGVGPGNYYPYVHYHSTLWFGEQTYTTAHSNYIQMAAELGVVGLAVLLWVIAAGLMAGHRASKVTKDSARWLPVAATGILAGIAAASLFGDYLFPSRGNNGLYSFGTTVYTWLIMGAAVASARVARKTEPKSGPPERTVDAGGLSA